MTFVGLSIAITLIGSGAGIAARGNRSWLTRGVALAGELVGVFLLLRLAHVWGLV